MKKISIVLPTYNGEKYLRKSIESVLNQTYQNWELILVNDCSTDDSPAIMQKYENKDPRIKVINNIENQKLPKSLNIGFAVATGDYFTWTSDDNRYKPQALEQMMNFLEDKPKAGLVYADMDFIDEAGNKTGEVSLDVENMYYNNCIGACFLYRADVAKDVGGYNPDWFLVEDYEYWLRIAEKYGVFHLPLNLYEYRFHSASLTEKRARQISEQLNKLRTEKLDLILERIQENQKAGLFVDMCTRDRELFPLLKSKFYGKKAFPDDLRWLERERTLQPNKQIILFGSGKNGKKALSYIGNDKVAFFADNNQNSVGKKMEGKEVISFERLKQIYKDYQIVISVDAKAAISIANQLESAGIREYITDWELFNQLRKNS